MEEFIGKKIKVGTSKGLFEGKMNFIDKNLGTISISNNIGIQSFNFDEILTLSEVKCSQDNNNQIPLKETDMYSLFYEAFNVFGPFEDHFILSVSQSLKKFLRDFTASSIKIIIGSDDVFGRIGLCFARIALDRVSKLDIDVKCNLNDLKTLQYKNAYENSGGCFTSNFEKANYSMILFACNRNYNFKDENPTASQVLILDIPSSLPFQAFTGVGLGFIPEHANICNKIFYLFDVGFGCTLCKKYKLPCKYKNSLVKIDLAK